MKKLVYGALAIGSLLQVSSTFTLPATDQVRRLSHQEDMVRGALGGHGSDLKTSWVPVRPKHGQA